MRRLFYKIFCSLIIFSISNYATAGILFEPYGGYQSGNLKYTITTPANEDTNTVTGATYGARLGLISSGAGLFLAGDVMAFSGVEKNHGTKVADWRQTDFYVDLGWQTPIGVRFYCGYGFKIKSDESASGSPDTFLTGSSFKAGVGYKFDFPVAFNFEYINYKFTDFDNGTFTGKLSDLGVKLDYSVLIGTVSFPMDIFGGGKSSSEKSSRY